MIGIVGGPTDRSTRNGLCKARVPLRIQNPRVRKRRFSRRQPLRWKVPTKLDGPSGARRGDGSPVFRRGNVSAGTSATIARLSSGFSSRADELRRRREREHTVTSRTSDRHTRFDRRGHSRPARPWGAPGRGGRFVNQPTFAGGFIELAVLAERRGRRMDLGDPASRDRVGASMLVMARACDVSRECE